MLAGGMASLDRATIEAGRNLGASRLRVLLEIVLPQVAQTLLVGLVLSFVTMLSVLSVPMLVAGSQPTMLTVDMAFRINAYGDYPTANALGVISYAMTAAVAWIYVFTIYDEHGQYGHPDHIQIYRVGARAAELAGTPRVYMSTMNRDYIRRSFEALAEAGEEPPDDLDPEFLD